MDMFWLPRLGVGPVEWRLPLTETSAAALADALFSVSTGNVSASANRSRVAFRSAVGTEPALALWLACQFPRDRVPASIDDICDWFLSSPIAKLHWSSESEAFAAPPQWQVGAWPGLAERSRLVARRCAEFGDRSPRAELLGLLHASCELLSLCGPTVRLTAEGDHPACLPDWLTSALVQLGSTGQLDSDLREVRAAMATCEHEIPPDAGTPQLAPTGAGWAAMLPRMTQCLSRLATLEESFSTALEAAKLDAMRELAYGASHEINNPLANISTRAQTLLVGEKDPERRRKLATINSQAFRAHEMISDIMLFAKPPRIDPAPFDLAELTDEVLAELGDDAAEQGTELRCELPRDQLSMFADRGHMAVALKALIRNSLEAIGMGGHIELSASMIAVETPVASQVELVVCDSGPGVPLEVRSSMFNPFFSGREAGRGLGLGLSKCWRIVTLHGGSITLDDTYSDGARFVICLPAGALHVVDPEFAAHG